MTYEYKPFIQYEHIKSEQGWFHGHLITKLTDGSLTDPMTSERPLLSMNSARNIIARWAETRHILHAWIEVYNHGSSVCIKKYKLF